MPCSTLAWLLPSCAAKAAEVTVTFDDPANYSGGTEDLPTTYTENGVRVTVPPGNHLDPFTDTHCATLGVLYWHDGPVNADEDNILKLSLVSGEPFDLVQLDFGNHRTPTEVMVTSAAGIVFNWSNLTYVEFDMPGMTQQTPMATALAISATRSLTIPIMISPSVRLTSPRHWTR